MKQASIQFRCRKMTSAPAASKPSDSFPAAASAVKEAEKDQDSRHGIESPTPDKLESRSRIKDLGSSLMRGKQLFENSDVDESAVQSEKIDSETTDDMGSFKTSPSVLVRSQEDDSIELPEEYKTLSLLFERMNTSIRLLALRKKLPTFRNISTQVEVLSKRKFSCSHLAQMKSVFPEAIQIEKILVHDEISLCMIAEMKVTLVAEAVGCHLNPDQSTSFALCKAFRKKLLDFFKSHPEGIDIPQAILPEPFNPGNQVTSKVLSMELYKEPSKEACSDLPLSSASHFPSAFHHQFCQKIIPEREKLETPASPAPLLSTSTDKNTELMNSPQMEAIQSNVSSVKSTATETYAECTSSNMLTQNSKVTPAKHSSIINTFITETPTLQTPKRPVPTTLEKFTSEDTELASEIESANSVRRSLLFGPPEVDGSLSDWDACTSARSGVHSHAYIKTTSSRSTPGDDVFESVTNQASDSAISVSENHCISEAGQEKHVISLGCLLDMFDTICVILRSTDCSCITKQELVHKIILNNLDIEETREVDEQLQLLEVLVPDWIYKKATSNGDCFYCIKKAFDEESIRARLVEAA